MGKRKIHCFEKIQDENSRNVTYCKRKKGLVKKAMELSLLCNQQIYLSVFDQDRQKLVVYSSTDEYDGQIAAQAESSDLRRCAQYEHFTNANYHDMKRRIKIDRKLQIAPSMQLFKIGEGRPCNTNVAKDTAKLKHIQEQYDKMPEEQQTPESGANSQLDSDEECSDNDIKGSKEEHCQGQLQANN